MKTLIVILGLSIATPVFACPGMEGHDETPKTADKNKSDKKETEKPAPKDTAKKDAPKPAPKPEAPKTGDKVSAK